MTKKEFLIEVDRLPDKVTFCNLYNEKQRKLMRSMDIYLCSIGIAGLLINESYLLVSKFQNIEELQTFINKHK